MINKPGSHALAVTAATLGGGLFAIAGTAVFHGLSASGALIAFACAIMAAALVFAIFWRQYRSAAFRNNRLRDSVVQLCAVTGGADAQTNPEFDDWVGAAEERVRSATRTVRSLMVERQQMQALLSTQTQERADFFANLSHELRSPLNAILGYSAILLDEPDAKSESTKGDLRRIRQAGHDLLNLIDDLLDQPQGGAGRESPGHLPFDLNALVDRVARRGTSRAAPVNTPDTLRATQCTVFGNRDRIGRALAALVDHCARLSPGGDIQIDTVPSPAQPDTVQVRFLVSPVSDDAKGIPERNVGMVNDGLVASVGGEMAASRPTPDSLQIVVTLPTDSRTKQNRHRVAEDMNPPDNILTLRDRKETRLALVIDDDPAAIDLLSRWVGRCGYRVVTANNGVEGLERAQECKPDIILLDALMPGKSGYDVLPMLRELPDMQCVPILMVTVDDDRERGLDVGATDVVRKPVTEAQLRSLIAIYEEPRSGDILIIDDDEDALEILDRTIRRLGFTPRRAVDGEEGLRAIQEAAPKAILLDLNMPKVNGFEFIEALSANPSLASIPLIVVSGAELSAPQHTKLVEVGARYFLKGSAAPREIAEGVWEAVA